MSGVTKILYEAKAAFPFNSTSQEYLTLFSGDYLMVLKECGEWVYARCKSTSCIGFCPKSYIVPVEKTFPYAELENEARCLVRHVFNEHFFKTNDEREIDFRLLDSLVKVLNSLPVGDESAESLWKSLDEIRASLGFPIIHRTKYGSFVTTHDLSLDTFGLAQQNSDISGSEPKNTSSISLELSMSINYQSPLRVCPRFYSLQNGKTVLTAPADFKHEGSDQNMQHILKFHNLEPSALSTLAIEIRVFSYKKFGESYAQSTQKPYASDYIGVAAEYLGDTQNLLISKDGQNDLKVTKTPRTLQKGSSVTMTLPFFLSKDTSNSNTFDYILSGTDNKIQLSENIPQIAVKVIAHENFGEAIPCKGNRSILSMRYPQNGSPSGPNKFEVNSLFIHMKSLYHKSSKKRTRISVKVVDGNKMAFSDAFVRTNGFNDGTCFDSLVEKGHTEFNVDEIVHIDLTKLSLMKSIVIFEVQRVSRSKGILHLSSFAIHRICEDQGYITVNKTGEPLDLRMFKPPKPEMTAKDYYSFNQTMDSIQNDRKISLHVDIRLLSTLVSSHPGINLLLNWESLVNSMQISDIVSLLKSIKSTDIKEVQYFYPQLLKQLSIIITTNKDKKALNECAMNEFMNIVQSIDEYAQRSSKWVMAFFTHYIDNILNSGDSVLRLLSNDLFENITTSLPDPKSKDDKANVSKCNSVCRAIPYLLKAITASQTLDRKLMPNKAGIKGGNTVSKDRLIEINHRLSDMVRKNETIYRQSTSFISRAYWMFCDILGDSMDPKEAANTVKVFLEANEVNCSEFIPNQNRITLLNDLVQTQFMQNRVTRAAIMPAFMHCLMINQNYRGFQADIFPVIQGLFFHMMRNSDNLSTEVQPFTYYFEQLLYQEDNEEMIKEEEYKQHVKLLLGDIKDINGQGAEDYLMNMVLNVVSDKAQKQIKDNQRIKLSLETPNNIMLLLLILYYIKSEILHKAILSRKNPISLIWKLLLTIKCIIESKIQYNMYFIIPHAFVNVISIIKNPSMSFPIEQIGEIIRLISSFYKQFLSIMGSINKSDRDYCSSVYPIDLNPIAGLLPEFLGLVPVDKRFDSDVFVPLFHFYVNSKDMVTRSQITKGFLLLITADYDSKSSLNRSENATTLGVSQLTESSTNVEELLQLFEESKVILGIDKMPKEFSQYFAKMTQMIGFMVKLSAFNEAPIYEDEISEIYLRILEFYHENQDKEFIPLFGLKLYRFNLTIMGNKVEAAETLIYIADKLDWNDNRTFEIDDKSKTSSPLKLWCYSESIKLLKDSLFYESAIEIIQEVKYYYMSIAHNYPKVAETIRMEALLYELISNGERNKLNEFYGAKFYGVFDKSGEIMKGKTYIYRRDGYSKSTDVLRAFQQKFPDAKVLPKPPTEQEILNTDIQFIYVFNMKPKNVPQYNPNMLASEYMVLYYCNVKEFFSEQPLRIRRAENIGEFAEWHRLVINYTIAKPLQSLIRRAEVIMVSELIDYSPIQCAIFDTSGKTMELVQKALFYYHHIVYNIPYDDKSVSNFTMLINGIVNAAVNGGTKVLQDLFLGKCAFAMEPENVQNRQTLQTAFGDQLKALDFALKVHIVVVPETYLALHHVCEENFKKMIETTIPVIGEFNINDNPSFGALPPTNVLPQFD